MNHSIEIDTQILRKNCTVLASLDDEALASIAAECEQVQIEAGELVLAFGQAVDQAFILLQGKLAAVILQEWEEGRIVNVIEVGELVGEIELLNGDVCVAEARALEDSRLLCLDRALFERLISEHESVWRSSSEIAKKRTGRLLLIQHIGQLFGTAQAEISDPLLRLAAEEDWLNFEQDVVKQLEEKVEWVRLQRSDFLFHEGDMPDGAYVLVSGLLGVRVEGENGQQSEVARIRQGEIVGELGLIVDAARSASITALRDCELFRITPEVFADVSQRYPRRMVNVYKTITERFYKHLGARPSPVDVSNIAIVSASESVRIGDFNQHLLKHLSRYKSYQHLTSQKVDQALRHPGVACSGESDFENARLKQWLNQQEAKSELLIYEGDQNWTHWNHRCIQQADEVFVLADATEKPDLASISSDLADSAQSWHLVLVHPPDTVQPHGTASWLTDERLDGVYHVRRGHEKDTARLARIIAGQSLGLVLGGGGARGFAHLGVLRVLEELGLQIDMIGGASIGAPIAGWVAQGRNASECLQAAIRVFHGLIDITLPVTSMIQGKRISNVINKQTASWDIEDFWLPFFCTSTSLTRFQSRVHLRGNSARAIRASVSIPGILPPVPEGDELLVDGGVMNNLPIDVMRQMNRRGLVMAIDVVAPRGLFARGDYGLSVSGWRAGLRSLVPWLKPSSAPPIASIITQSMMVGSSHARTRILEQNMADYYQNIHVKDIGLLQFEAANKAAEIGYEQSFEPIKQWVKKMQMLD